MTSKQVEKTLPDFLFPATEIKFKCGHSFVFRPFLSEKGFEIDVLKKAKNAFCDSCNKEIFELLEVIKAEFGKDYKIIGGFSEDD